MSLLSMKLMGVRWLLGMLHISYSQLLNELGLFQGNVIKAPHLEWLIKDRVPVYLDKELFRTSIDFACRFPRILQLLD